MVSIVEIGIRKAHTNGIGGGCVQECLESVLAIGVLQVGEIYFACQVYASKKIRRSRWRRGP